MPDRSLDVNVCSAATPEVRPTVRPTARIFPVEVWSSLVSAIVGLASAVMLRARAQRRARYQANAKVAKESARALARAARLATVGEITASITHEVNQPLAAILNNAETGLLLLQRKQGPTELLHAILEDIRNDALRASEVARRTRALLQEREMLRAPVDVSKIAADAVDLLWLQAQRRGVLLITRPSSTPWIDGDEMHLQQVVINLITNALDATETSVAGAKRVVVSTAHESGKVLVRVTDSGRGIPPARLEAIFESFNTSKAEGLGMGLSIARSIVKAHGGRIFAENNQSGPGATVSFELPIAVDAPGAPG